MSNDYLGLLFIDDRACDPTAPVTASVYAMSPRRDYGPPLETLLTRRCESILEFEGLIKKLKRELDSILSDARRKFAAGPPAHK
jgi:hypothetical protein